MELTDDRLVFCKLHGAFTWILKAGGLRLTERLVEAPPTEDAIIDCEKQEGEEPRAYLLSHPLLVDPYGHTLC